MKGFYGNCKIRDLPILKSSLDTKDPVVLIYSENQLQVPATIFQYHYKYTQTYYDTLHSTVLYFRIVNHNSTIDAVRWRGMLDVSQSQRMEIIG